MVIHLYIFQFGEECDGLLRPLSRTLRVYCPDREEEYRMGNSVTKEQGAGRSSGRLPPSESVGTASDSHSPDPRPPAPPSSFYNARSGRGSRPDLSVLLGIGSSSDRDAPGPETRRETKQEREARRAEKERVARLKERERSMREEHVDGGYLVTQGVYTGTEDFNKGIVRHLMVPLL